MDIIIQNAKDGDETAIAEGFYLHSNYAPRKEAQRFVENLTIPYTPSAIIITEPALSYAADFLRNKFPELRIGVIRYSDYFEKYNSKFDFVLNYFEHPDFEVYLESIFTEEELLTTLFISWTASAKVFPQEDKKVWTGIKAAMERSKTLLITRQYFEKKWFLNSCRFIKNTSKLITFEGQIDKDILIISSGPSLIPFIDSIRQNQNKFFIICLSSAISLCIKYQIKPDLCMTTDGGYWAGEHLKILSRESLPLAMPLEGYCSKNLLSELNILPLDYGDGISSDFISAAKLPAKKAIRNGTVSGTALLFAYNYGSRNIYLAGLDLACKTGFQHTQPNQLEINSSLSDNRIHTKTGRLTRSELTNGSLDIYRNWFITNPLNTEKRKVFRLMEEADKKNDLGWISDISLKTFEAYISKIQDIKDFSFTELPVKKDSDFNPKLFFDDKKTDKWKKQIFPLDYVQLSHNPENQNIKEKIENEWKQLINKAISILL